MRAIYARSENGVLGLGENLPWRLPTDLRRFRLMTEGKTVIMGPRTYLSIGRPLPGRHTVVVSRDGATDRLLRHAVTVRRGPINAVCDEFPDAYIVGGPQFLSLVRHRITDLLETVVHTHIFSPEAEALPDDWVPQHQIGSFGPIQREGDQYPMSFNRYHDWLNHTPVVALPSAQSMAAE